MKINGLVSILIFKYFSFFAFPVNLYRVPMRSLLLPLLLLASRLFSQEIPGERTIAWYPVQKTEQGFYYLDFENATYPDLNTLLPNYYELIKIENNFDTEVEIYDKTFEVIDNEDIKKLDKSVVIPDEISLQTELAWSMKQPFLLLQFIPLRKNPQTGKVEKLVHFSLKLKQKQVLKSSSSPASSLSFAAHSVLRSGYWYRIRIEEDGVYRITYNQLRDMGFSNPANIRIYGNGRGMLPEMNDVSCEDDLTENSIRFENGSDGVFSEGDYLLFYGRGPHSWKHETASDFFARSLHRYSKANYYFLTADLGKGKEITKVPSGGTRANPVTEYDAYVHHEINERNLIKSGNEWFGEHFDIQTIQDFTFNVPDISITEDAKLRIRVLAGAAVPTSFSVFADGTLLGDIPVRETDVGQYTANIAYDETRNFTFRPAGSQPVIRLRYNKSSASAQGWLDYITLNVRRKLVMTGDQMQFRDTRSAGKGNISRFILSTAGTPVKVWDVTDPESPLEVTLNESAGQVTFTLSTDTLREFIAFRTGGQYLIPGMAGDNAGPVSNQDLHSLPLPDYIIISHPDFITEARRLAASRHDHNGLDTLVVTPGQIYNEFSSGKPDVSALRNFIRMFYSRASTLPDIPRYLLLFGDGSYDNLTASEQNTNFILTYQSDNSLSPVSSFVTDDFFGLLDENEGGSSGLLDIGIGRFPVSTYEEAVDLVDKIVSYDQPDRMGDWRNIICFIGDDEDGNVHMSQADELARYVETNYPHFNLAKIYLDAYNQTATPSGNRYPAVNEALNQRINKGALIINYTGHGGARGLAHEQILTINDIVQWENKDRLPLFITATCEFSRFDDYEETSAGEYVLMNPSGGGIALLSTTRLVYSGPNHTLNQRFYEFVFNKDAYRKDYRLGDIIRLTKNAAGTGINKRNFTLLGDPATELAAPSQKIITTAINGISTAGPTDTLKALSKVSINGEIQDLSGNRLNGFNGILYPTVYDKADMVNTLANDGGTPFSFSLRSRILYKGKATVNNGTFTFSFMVPKDISYNYDYGKISLYASSSEEDAGGSFSRIIIGGSSGTVSEDRTGPEIRLYMNDENFVTGGITNRQPTLLVFLHDSSGINTIGNGIGHDITAILDKNSNNSIVLNDFYEANTDSYQEGKISYKFKSLDEGAHSLKVKVWDIHNNTAEDYLDFIVTNPEEFILKHVLNYPNPFTTNTSFFFEHNQANAELDILIQIFTVSGKLVRTFDRHVNSTGFRTEPIVWDGLDDFGNRIGRGVYIYRVSAHTASGQTAEKFEKLVILR